MKFYYSTQFINRFSGMQWWFIAIVAAVISHVTMGWLNAMYAQTEFPVSFMVGQTAFDGELIKSYYAVLLDKNTMDLYIKTQFADFLYMATVAVHMVTLTIAVYKIQPPRVKLATFSKWMIILSPAAPLFDASENLISFFMIFNPADFANWIAYPYSSMAVGKFAAYMMVYVWAFIGIVLALFATSVKYYQYIRTTRKMSKPRAH